MDDEQLTEDASGIADRRAAGRVSTSEGMRLLDRLARLFGSSSEPLATSGDTLFVWGPLQVRRLIGSGSFGEVYEAWDPTLHREVALKLRAPETGTLRWLDEARNLARVRHEHIVTVHGADVIDGRAGIWTERVIGRTLEEELVESGSFAEAEATRIGYEIASALAAVHAAGLIHGDVKTSNIMLEGDETPRRSVLVDFGSADQTPDEGDVPAYMMGTPLTMAPEVLDGKPASAASDVYGLGATLFRLLTGHYPVEAESIDQLQRAHRSSERAQVRALAKGVSARLARTVERALDLDPAKRWPDAKRFERALRDAADPTRRIRVRAAAIIAGVVGLAASFILFLVPRGGGPLSGERLARPRDPRAFHEAWRYQGPEEGADLAWVVTVGDFDHDGFADVVGVEPHWKGSDGTPRGRAVVFRGSAQGPSPLSTTVIEGEEPNEEAYSVANAGDTNGDGVDELLVSWDVLNASDFPRVAEYRWDASGAPVKVWMREGEVNNSGLGHVMGSAGDVNGDGFGDVLIIETDAPDLLPREGRIMLFLGSANGLSDTPLWSVRGGEERTLMGAPTRLLGDMNGDGFDDVMIGAPYWDDVNKTDCGQARIYLGSAHGLAAQPVVVIEGTGTNTQLGQTVGGAGDVNHDGYADALTTESLYSDGNRPEVGRVLLFLGGPQGPSPTPDYELVGRIPYAHFGRSFGPLGDVNGDGFADVAISSDGYSKGKAIQIGMVEVYCGGPHGFQTRPLWRAVGDSPRGIMGVVVNGGDFNGDGVEDIVVGAPRWGTDRGLLTAYLHLPRTR